MKRSGTGGKEGKHQEGGGAYRGGQVKEERGGNKRIIFFFLGFEPPSDLPGGGADAARRSGRCVLEQRGPRRL